MSLNKGDSDQVSLAHIGFAVKDAEATSRFLTSICGLGPWQSVDYVSPKGEMVVGQPFRAKILSNKCGAIGLEIWEMIDSPNSTWAQHIEKKGEGIHHIAFKVPNLKKTVKELQNQGNKVLVWAQFKGAERGALEGKAWCYMETGPGGIIVEFMDF